MHFFSIQRIVAPKELARSLKRPSRRKGVAKLATLRNSTFRAISRSILVITLIATGLSFYPKSSAAAVHSSQYWLNNAALRLSGTDRYETATKVSEYEFGAPGIASTIIVASGEGFPDALAAGPFASRLNAPLILVKKDELPEVARRNIKWVFDGKFDISPDVIIVGGKSAISDTVELAIRAINPNLETLRLAGIDRYETARLVADYYQSPGLPSSIFLANGNFFPDALTASGPASDKSIDPNVSNILLVKGMMLDPNLSRWIDDKVAAGGLKNIYLVGGPNVLDPRVEDEISFIAQQHGATLTVMRLAGNDRYETSKAVADQFYGSNIQSVGIASGENFPDALVGGQDSGKAFTSNHQQAFLLTSSAELPTPIANYLSAHASSLTTAVMYGGTSAVSDSVKSAVESYL